MKFALLGADEETLSLVRYLADQPHDEVAAIYEPGEYEASLAALAPRAAVRRSWESLLHEPVAEAAIIAGGPAEERAEPLVKLAKAGMPLLVVWPACDVVTAYELEMIRRDTQAPLVPLIPGRLHPAVAELAALAAGGEQSPIGAVEQLAIERAMRDCERERVLRQLTRDVSLVRAVAGEVNKVGAVGPAADAPRWTNLNVHLSGAGRLVARWSMHAPEDGLGATLTLYGDRGKAILDMPADGRPWSLAVTGAQPSRTEFQEWNESRAVLETFARAARGEAMSPSWQDACRDGELAATVERSLARGKTIELYDEEISEEATFKGMMAVGGCGVLLLGLLGVLAAAVIEGLQLPFRHHLAWRLWPIYLLGPTVLFLGLQLFRLVFYDRPAPMRDAAAPLSEAEQPLQEQRESP